ncbi:protein LHCP TRANSLOCATION DEFECT [Amaranthus tricolor]|uniref:protein LHCP TRANSLOCATION DEFECT n=1 Tax=Amaranthus tricolor TaxID=29722 RepID=UPI002582BCB7|nr:protein LHCP TRANSLOCATION DEFECT [Amaranthus tricolor]
MASISCSIQLTINSRSSSSSHPTSIHPMLNLPNGFLGIPRNSCGPIKKYSSTTKLGPSNGGRAKCWFRFNAESAGVYGSQSRDDFDRDDVEQYFNYMGMLAVEGSYDKMEALLNQDIHPVDILLLMAASEGDKPKIEELLRAGAQYDVKDADGRTALDRANDEIRDFIINFKPQKA